MPAGDSRPEALADTTVALALLVEDHEGHEATLAHVGRRRIGLSGHAVFETFSVLTRLPSPMRRSPATVVRLMRANFPVNCHLSPAKAEELASRLAPAGIAGGAVYDALVGAAAAEIGLPLLTSDRRALATYRALGVDAELIGQG